MENQSNPTTVDISDITTAYKAADILKVHFSSIYRMMKRGVLHPIIISGQLRLSIKEVNELKEKRDKENIKIK